MRLQVGNRIRRAVLAHVARRRTGDQLNREQPTSDHALMRRTAEPEADVGAIFYPVVHAVFQLDVGRDGGMCLAELVDEAPEDALERRPRSDDAQRAGDLPLRAACRLQRAARRI
jgi:hypothetical protein